MPDIKELTQYFKSSLYKDGQKEINSSKNEAILIKYYEVEYFVKQLKNKRAPGPDGLKSEDLKCLPTQVTENLNSF